MINILSIVCFFLLHDFYVSVSYMEYDAERNAIEIQKKIFFDDLELAIRKSYKLDNFDIINDDQERVIFYIEKYLLENIKLTVNGKIEEFNYLGHEYINGTIHCYFEVLNIRRLKNIDIHDSSLFLHFDGQENLVYFEMNNTLSTIRLKNPKLSEKIIFKN